MVLCTRLSLLQQLLGHLLEPPIVGSGITWIKSFRVDTD